MNKLLISFFSPTTLTCLGSVSASYASGPKIDPRVRHILLWKLFSSSADSRRTSCLLLANNGHLILVNCTGAV